MFWGVTLAFYLLGSGCCVLVLLGLVSAFPIFATCLSVCQIALTGQGALVFMPPYTAQVVRQAGGDPASVLQGR